MTDHAVMPLPDPRLASIERRLALAESRIDSILADAGPVDIERRINVVVARVDAIAEIVAPHPNAAAAQRAKSNPGLGDAVIAVRNAMDALNHALRRLIERAAP